MRLILIRHAESLHSQHGVIGGPHGCQGLTERGRDQAQLLANRLTTTGELADCRTLLTSPWPRARQTAAVLADALPLAAFDEDPALCELHPGAADGLTWVDYRARFAAFDLQAWPDRPFAPGGESWSAFVGRITTALDRLAARHTGQTVVAVTHAGVIVIAWLVLADLIGARPTRRLWLEPAHTALTEWSVTGERWQLVRYNDAAHLQTRDGEAADAQ